MSVKSWDLFDTLVTDRFMRPAGDHLPDLFRIASNCDEVTPYVDVVVSDYYCEKDAFLVLRNIAKLNNNIYVSSEGKYTGSMWKELSSELDISLHTGDNKHSDVKMPLVYGINSRHCTKHLLSEAEQAIYDFGATHLALLMREGRLSFHKDGALDMIVEGQSQCNFPMLFLASIKLNQKIAREGHTRVVMIARDCCLWHKVLPLVRKLFCGAYDIKYISSGRICSYRPTRGYKREFVAAMGTEKDKVLIVDIHGTGASMRHLIKLCGIDETRAEILFLDGGIIKNHVWRNMEVINSDVEPPFADWDVRFKTKLQHLYDKFKDAHEAFDFTLGCAKHYSELWDLNDVAIENSIQFLNDKVLPKYVGKHEHGSYWACYREIECEEVATRARVFGDDMKPMDNDESYLTMLANKFRSDKGTEYLCKHHYTRHYSKLFQDIRREKVALLELGLQIGSSGSEVPSLRMWREYFYHPCAKIHGIDLYDFVKHSSDEDNIKIWQHDCGNREELKHFATTETRSLMYDVIIDDASHASEHQQTALSELWCKLFIGGMYVIEDLHWQPNDDDIKTLKGGCMKTQTLLENWKEGGNLILFDTDPKVSDAIRTSCVISFYDSSSTRWPGRNLDHAMAVLTKTN